MARTSTLAASLLERTGARVPLLADRGFIGFDLWRAVVAGSQVEKLPPALGGVVQHCSDRAEAALLAGCRPITLTLRRVSPKVRSIKLECRMPL